ncbi:eukaryotic translation initiation factor 3 subunit E [Lineolata rhizophorae]|uniref:Eukaryotic translation initiation factor 3 subunit E n=1 Tax=Lineolata rhizophorae TaxID=578093 RepID=A0A6A6P6F3_9PEZI|nr:eukaryotic translation initiation factor 3 subunit E [Lineolata rhizophorae]
MADGANAPTGADDISKTYDLLPKLIPHLDRHLVLQIILFLGTDDDEEGPSKEILQTQFELLKDSNMADYLADLYCKIHDTSEPPAEYAQRRDAVLQQYYSFQEHTAKMLELLDDDEVVGNLRSDKVANFNYLKETHGVTMDMVNSLYDFGQFQYSRGAYDHAGELLYRFTVLSTDNDKIAQATWGKLACDILRPSDSPAEDAQKWESVMEGISKVRENIDTRLFSAPLAQLHQRTWLVHWALFPFFNHEPARDTLTELFFSAAYINTIQTACPWILRYLAAAVITNRSAGRSRNTSGYAKQLKDLVRVVRQEGYEYSDPVTDFVRALYVDFDFEEAQKKLLEASELLRNDFFLCSVADAFVDAARHLISESYCKIHQRIDIKDLSTRLGLSQDEGEKWIVNLIRDTRVDAKIDYQAGTVVMNHPPQSVYQQVIERTKGMFFRTQVLSGAVAK